MPTIILHGCSLSDSVFTTDKAIFGVEICWNITRIQRDADSGMFGPPVSVPMSALPPMSSLHDANVDMDKVAGMLSTKPDVLQNPVLQVLVDVNGTTYRIPVDGNHRILARRMAGYSFFESYVVPIELEGRYRVTETVLRDGGYPVHNSWRGWTGADDSAHGGLPWRKPCRNRE